jgi:hypothetical protein
MRLRVSEGFDRDCLSKEAEEVDRKSGVQNHMPEFKSISTQSYPVINNGC